MNHQPKLVRSQSQTADLLLGGNREAGEAAGFMLGLDENNNRFKLAMTSEAALGFWIGLSKAAAEAAALEAKKSSDQVLAHSPVSKFIVPGLERLGEFALTVNLFESSKFLEVPSDGSLPDLLPAPLRTSIFIRKCYRRILRRITEDRAGCTHTVVTGTPGIGKSAFALLLIHHLAKRGCKVIYKYEDRLLGSSLILLDFSHSDKLRVDFACQNDLSRMNVDLVDSATWLIVDGPAPKAQHGGSGRMVVLSSPNDDNFHEFGKAVHSEVLWMDIWSLNEMEECRTVLYKGVGSLEVALRYAEFGGVIRQVLAKPESSFVELERNLGAQTAEKLLSMESLGRRDKVSHSFAHIRVS